MLIKSADDRSKRIALLEDLQHSKALQRNQHDWLREELVRLRRGIQGERDAAHYLNSYLRDDPNRAVIHDLRISVDGETAQIDHLVMTRSLNIYLLETKNFGGSVHINDRGEFSVQYAGDRVFGIESPIEQSRRHEGPLAKLLARLEIGGRAGVLPKFHHCVLVHPKATIARPPAKTLDTRIVMKADQFREWHEQFIEKMGVVELLGSMLQLRNAETLREYAEKLVRQHRPEDLLRLPEFMKPSSPAPMKARESSPVFKPQPVVATAPVEGAGQKRLVCATCAVKISYAEGKFCWNNARRFGGLQYCRDHQSAF